MYQDQERNFRQGTTVILKQTKETTETSNNNFRPCRFDGFDSAFRALVYIPRHEYRLLSRIHRTC